MAKRIAKSYAEMREEVQKFNPFHDALGRFSSSHGFKSYSANPKTRAGALAIQRSNSAGHGRTLNVHQESKGESIQQNANWLATGQKPKVPAAVSRQRYQQRKLKQQQAAAQQAAQKPAAPKPAAVPKAPQTAQKPPVQAPKQTQTQKPANQHQMAQGKDISQTFSIQWSGKGSGFAQITKLQGYDKKGKVVDQAEFDAAVKQSGIIAYRTWSPGMNYTTNKQATANDFKRSFMNDDSVVAAGSGGRVYGSGTYIAANSKPVPGKNPLPSNAKAALKDSQMYGSGKSATAQITLDPSAKIADYYKLEAELDALPKKTRLNRFAGDVGIYAAAKGYDAVRAVDAGLGCDYITILNRTKAIILND